MILAVVGDSKDVCIYIFKGETMLTGWTGSGKVSCNVIWQFSFFGSVQVAFGMGNFDSMTLVWLILAEGSCMVSL